jgi:hypothetical protein
MLLALLGSQVELGPVSGVSDQEVQAALQEVKAEAGDLHLTVQVVGGVTKVLLVLELRVHGEVDASEECSAPPNAIAEARPCIHRAVERFRARTRPIDLAVPRQPLAVESEEPGHLPYVYALLGASAAMAIAGTVLAWFAVSAHRDLEDRALAGEDFDALEREERRYRIASASVLGGAVLSLGISLTWALAD